MRLPWLKIAGGAGGVLLAGALFAFSVGQAMGEARALVEKGEALADARWKAEIAAVTAEQGAAVAAAREAGRLEADAARRAAEQRAAGAEAALKRERATNATFDAASRARWPDDYFFSVCGHRPECLPPD